MTLINGYEIPSLTNTWHSDTYAAISPLRPELSAKGKTVIITGAGSGIGRETAKAFATAGAEHIALIGRRIANVSETKSIVEAESPSVRVTAHEADVVDLKATVKAAAEIGKWDVLLLNAGYGETPAKAGDADVDDWWKTFEVGRMLVTIGGNVYLQRRLDQREREHGWSQIIFADQEHWRCHPRILLFRLESASHGDAQDVRLCLV